MTTPLRRPSTYDEGVAQLRAAVRDTEPTDKTTPRGVLWDACNTLVNDKGFINDGMCPLYAANQLVSFLFHTIVPHMEERLRCNTLRDEYETAMRRPENVRQNGERFDAIIVAVVTADKASCARQVDVDYARMRKGLRPISHDPCVVAGLRLLYVTSKLGRKCIDLIMNRLIETFGNDTCIMKTSTIPMEAMFM